MTDEEAYTKAIEIVTKQLGEQRKVPRRHMRLVFLVILIALMVCGIVALASTFWQGQGR